MNVAGLLRLARLDDDLTHVDAALRRSVASEDPFLSEVAGHLIKASGKRLRPALAVASALAGGGEISADVIHGSCSVELVHLGSLYHDDVIDDAETRHGVESVNAKWGNLVAIVAGDFLLARASEIAARLGTEVSALLAATIGRLCEGEVGEVQAAFDTGRSEERYLAAIAGKTASLLSASCRIGALTAGLEPPVVDALAKFGQDFGMAFQVRDDVLDVVSTEAALGKPAGHDMVQGVYTLPVIRALADHRAGPELRGLLGGPIDDAARDKALGIVRTTDGIASCLAMARGFADDAAHALAPLPPSPLAESLAGLAHQLLDDVVDSQARPRAS